jgi:hypothetical protein
MANTGNGNADDGDEGNGEPKRDYDVGYGKPPKHSRFKPGQSGNPRGPKKGSRGLRKDLHKALGSTHSIRVNGRTITGTAQELAVIALTMRAAAGDIRANRQLFDLTMKIFGPDDRGRERGNLSSLDQELFDRLMRRLDAEDETGVGDSAAGAPSGGDAAGDRPDDAAGATSGSDNDGNGAMENRNEG